ncbi:MAG TPA: Gfo/Idh/MocA family oxidoreductase [Verrucomicrobiae bacterium]|jgi:predicted dehydrogenase
MKRYKVVMAGMGKRGMHHATAFHANPRFELAGICSTTEARLQAAAAKFPHAQAGSDARSLANSIKPDIFCFSTLPNLRSEMVQVGIDSGAKLIAFEKPLALSSAEGMKTKQMLDAAKVKAVISHQHRYGAHYRKVHDIISSGAIGCVNTVYGTATGWMTHMMSHLIDYALWFNTGGSAQWVMAQAAGRGKLADSHPSPDYIAGFIHFSNGVRGIIDCGAGAPDVQEVPYWWRKCRIGAQGSEGFAEVMTGGGWRAMTRNGALKGEGSMNYDLDMPPYVQEMADWLDDEKRIHPCNFATAYEGFEIMMAMCRSVIEGGQIALPLTSGMDEIAALREKLPSKKVLFSLAENAKEYPA